MKNSKEEEKKWDAASPAAGLMSDVITTPNIEGGPSLAPRVRRGCEFYRLAETGTPARSMDQVCLLFITSCTRFLSRMSSRSGEERSGRKGTKMGCLTWVVCAIFRCGEGACKSVDAGGGEARVAGEGKG
jgi:hypothetical protein